LKYPKECKSIYKRDTCIGIFIAALFIIAQLWNQSRCSTMDEWNTHTQRHTPYHGILLSQKEK
jgi:hypothetical protein